MDVIWIVIAFAFGAAAREVGLPPLVGYLGAGFVLYAFGIEGEATLKTLADLGITLLLFSIGLKLQVRSLLRPEVWAVASAHMAITVLAFGSGLLLLSVIGLPMFRGLDLVSASLIAFALSFSSTVFAVKVLEEKGEMVAVYGRIAIGILIIQDIVAVIFLAMSTGKIPSPWALLLFGLIPARFLLFKVLERSGHGELLILFGLVLAMGGAVTFELVGMKGDLGALIVGVLLANHGKASELARSLLGLKDIFLVGFFLSIGLAGPPSVQALGVATLLALIMPLKVGLFFWLLSRFRLRARTSLLASLSLANYSEFGLIVGSIGVANGWMGSEWLVVVALALALTFVIASPLNTMSNKIYLRYRTRLKSYEIAERIPDEEPIDAGEATILVFGMGRVGTGAYDKMRERFGDTVLGIDLDATTVQDHRAAGRNVVRGSATDPDFWSRFNLDVENIRVAMLAMPSHIENLFAAEQLVKSGVSGTIAATAKYGDEVEAFAATGIDSAFNLYAEAGAGFAEHVCEQLAKPGGRIS